VIPRKILNSKKDERKKTATSKKGLAKGREKRKGNRGKSERSPLLRKGQPIVGTPPEIEGEKKRKAAFRVTQ